MTVFKSIWFKCIVCLLSIAVVSGALLAILNDLLLVSPEMRTARAIKKIYGEEKEYSVVLDIDDKERGDEAIIYDGVGSVNKIYEVGSDMLFQTTGYKGYKEGTITLWVLVVNTDGVLSIDKVLVQSYKKQTLMGNLTDNFYGKFQITDVTAAYNEDKYFFADKEQDLNIPENNIVTGATKSSTAAANAVNCVIRYIGESL